MALALTARCAFVLQNRAQGTVSTNAYLGKGNPLRVPRCIPSGCPVPFMTHSANPRGIAVVFGSWLSASGPFRHRRQRVAVASPARRASVLPQAPPRPMGAFAAPLDTLDQPSAVWMPPRFRAWTRPKGLDAAPHGLPAGVHFPIYRKIYLSQHVI